MATILAFHTSITIFKFNFIFLLFSSSRNRGTKYLKKKKKTKMAKEIPYYSGEVICIGTSRSSRCIRTCGLIMAAWKLRFFSVVKRKWKKTWILPMKLRRILQEPRWKLFWPQNELWIFRICFQSYQNSIIVWIGWIFDLPIKGLKSRLEIFYKKVYELRH